MAVPSYTEDLTDLTLCENNTDWDECDSPWGQGGAPQGGDPDWPYIQGSYAVTQVNTKTGIAGMMYDNTAGTGGHGTDGAYFIWQVFSSPNLDSYANGGLRVMVGDDYGSFYSWDVGGNDIGVGVYMGWQNHVVNTTVSADDTIGGYAGGTEDHVGAAVNVTVSIGKGEPHNIDVIRYGRGSAIFQDGQAANYATIDGFATANDDNATRWGLIQKVDGGYLWKGRMLLGSTNAVDFRDTGVIVFIANTPKVTANFNTVEISHIDSNIEMTGFQFIVLDPVNTASLGRWITTNDADVALTSCAFTDMNTFVFDSNTTIDTCTFRRCGLVTQGGSDFDDTLFDEPSGSVGFHVEDLDLVDNCDFVSDGTGYAMELDSSMAGNSYTMAGCTFTGYAAVDGVTGNECIYNNINGGDVTIAVGTGQQPTVHDANTSSTIITSSVPLYVIVKDEVGAIIVGARVGIYNNSTRAEIKNQLTDASGEVDTSYTGATPVEVEVRVRMASVGATKYINYSSVQTIASLTGLSLSVTLAEDPNNNATV